MNKKTTLDRLAFALGVTLNQIDKLPVKPAGVEINDVNDVVVTDDTTCGSFYEYLDDLRRRFTDPNNNPPGCDSTKFLDNYNDWPCVSLRRNGVGYLVVDYFGLPWEDPMKYFKDDGAFIQGVYKSLCQQISSGIKNGCLTPSPLLLMKTYRDRIKKFDFKPVRSTWHKEVEPIFKGPTHEFPEGPIKEVLVIDGLFVFKKPEDFCKRCLESTLDFIRFVIEDLKLHFSNNGRSDFNGTIFESSEAGFEKVFRKIWEEIIACTMDAIEPAGSVL